MEPESIDVETFKKDFLFAGRFADGCTYIPPWDIASTYCTYIPYDALFVRELKDGNYEMVFYFVKESEIIKNEDYSRTFNYIFKSVSVLKGKKGKVYSVKFTRDGGGLTCSEFKHTTSMDVIEKFFVIIEKFQSYEKGLYNYGVEPK